MKTLYFAFLLAILALSTPTRAQTGFDKNNPFFAKSTLPMQAPAFDKIKDADFKPAIIEAIRQKREEIEAIVNSPAAATFQNTVVAMEKAGQMLARVNNVFGILKGANTNAEIQKTDAETTPLLAALNDAIYLNTRLFKRVRAVYDNRMQLKNAESRRLAQFYYKSFLMAGANLSETDKKKLSEFNLEGATLSNKFGRQLLAATRAGGLLIADKAELAGLNEAEIEAAAQSAKAAGQPGKWLIVLQNTTQQPYLKVLTNRSVRQRLFEASWARSEKGDDNDTRATIAQIAEIRAQKAKLLGFPNFSAWRLQNQMAKTPATVDKFLNDMAPVTIAKVKEESEDIQKLIDEQNGGFKVQPWDWTFYAEQLRKARFDLNESEVKPYMEAWTVLEKGVFYSANLLYGITFKERKDLPVYNPEVRVYDVFDKDGSLMALFYCDYFKRDNKRGGAWMDFIIPPSKLLGTKPVVYNVANFEHPAPGQPALLTSDEVRTMFHEFGHMLHGIFLTTLSADLVRDFLEFPSQFNEQWALDPKVLKNYAVHYHTKQPLPKELEDKIKKAGKFNQAYTTAELLAADYLDMEWHKLTADKPVVEDVNKFEQEALRKNGVDLPQVPPRYRSTYFNHIWNGAYESSYYGYMWTSMLAYDSFYWFKEHGGLNRRNGQRFRDMVLAPSFSMPLDKLFRDFRGRGPSVTPMMIERGLMKK